MANLPSKTFLVRVFFSGSLLQIDPDIEESVSALTERSAIVQVMGSRRVSSAGVVYIRDSRGGELWLHDVRLNNGQLSCRFPVRRQRTVPGR